MSAATCRDDSVHIESHGTLLQQPEDDEGAGADPPGQLDAIVVPTIRPLWLRPAIALAGDMGCALVVLCTTPEQAAQAMQECRQMADDVLVTYVPPSAAKHLPALMTSGHPETSIVPSGHVDIARKRNVGLLLGRLCGWHAMMFLDDDIRGLTASAVSGAAGLATRFQAAGFRISNYPDNSVVCHAYRLAGGAQDVFPGASSLVIDMTRSDTVFPPIYNEDWLFLFDAAQRRSIALAGTASQLEYDPFAKPERAESEEFGDVIAEGLYRLLHAGENLAGATRPYWQATLERRLRLIDHIADELLQGKDSPVTGHVLMSLTAARRRLAGITDLACLSYVRAWRTDVDTWRRYLTDLPVLADLAGAAKYLDLPTLDRA